MKNLRPVIENWICQSIHEPNSTFRVLYAVKIGADIWVIHAFQKKLMSDNYNSGLTTIKIPGIWL